MQYNKYALENKIEYLDAILSKMDLLHKVLDKRIGSQYDLKHIERIWEPGGGSTLFKVSTLEKEVFLKVKHKTVLIESKLEEEKEFSHVSSLENEYETISELKEQCDFVPEIVFFEEEEGFHFLAFEYIEMSFMEKVQLLNTQGLLELWGNLIADIEQLYNNGIVHTDIHENNIRFKSEGASNQPIIIDFEESKHIKQYVDFRESLDYRGYNGQSEVGLYPYHSEESYTVQYNCLLRLKEVIKDHLGKSASDYVSECNYDTSNGICTSIDHGLVNDTYQSINNKYLQVNGQRTEKDKRLILLKKVLRILSDQPYTYIDVGSNNGQFCREIYREINGENRCIGLEGFPKFNVLARALAFLEDCEDIEYHDFVCGEDEIRDLNVDGQCLMSICSVWHHIEEKEKFLVQLKCLDLQYIFLEMATQEACYNGHPWEEELDDILEKLSFKTYIILGFSADYRRPLILAVKEDADKRKMKKFKRIAEREAFAGRIKRVAKKLFK